MNLKLQLVALTKIGANSRQALSEIEKWYVDAFDMEKKDAIEYLFFEFGSIIPKLSHIKVNDFFYNLTPSRRFWYDVMANEISELSPDEDYCFRFILCAISTIRLCSVADLKAAGLWTEETEEFLDKKRAEIKEREEPQPQ